MLLKTIIDYTGRSQKVARPYV